MAEEKQLLPWVQVIASPVLLVIAGAIAYGGVTARIDAMVESLRFLQPLPVQIEQLRGDMSQQIATIATEQASRLAELSERVSRVEGAVERHRAQLEALLQ